jgi:TonB family protein
VKGAWTNVAPRPGLVAKVRFSIAANGNVSGIRIEEASGNGVFDSSALRAVERANPLPPPPARYVSEFREFIIEFHSEERGGQVSG